MITAKVWYSTGVEETVLNKEKTSSGLIVKAQISMADGKYYTDRTVYRTKGGIRCVKVNGSFFPLYTYESDPRYKVLIWF